ncbi:DUF3164 family protein [Comamonas testosteroni]|uniref:Sulfate transporter n=1 Tax=Comamonas testosteroni (strain DSM 14576 / KF-1) TaxID=399795 RepID=B7WXS7_COMTK|nr:DUF3164 family protein [Comamonas testosteroni]EED67929.1 conserved hypothetical protein [Comamonas testosteroni KF-1]WQG66046.1 DUF3164 family protein [Comamonas testosteroni]
MTQQNIREAISAEAEVPAGMMRDGQGRLWPMSLVKPIDQARDALVHELVAIAKEENQRLTQAKAKIFGDVAAFVDLSAEQYGVHRGGKKGNITLFTFDGRYKLQIATSESIRFDERLHAAKDLLDQCAAEWTDGSRDEVRIVIQETFRTDKEGNLSVGRILGLRRWDIKDPRWKEAMRAIGDSIQVVGSKQYARFYERVGDTDRYAPIPLDMVAV